MAVRNLLHINKVDSFARWMEERGWLSVPTKGVYEVLRLVKAGEKPIILYKKGGANQHVSIENRLFPIVRAFILETREEST